MTRFFASLALTALSLFATLHAQETRSVPPPEQLIWIDPAQGKLEPIVLQDVAIDIRIQGFVASTTIDLTFANPNARVLEGELVFPLATGQSITGYALEVEGKLRRGVVVPKETARVAFEQITRQGIDPGLAEMLAGNVFRTRLYPIPANGTKRVALSFDQPLLDAGDAYRYVLPLQFTQPVKSFRVHAEAVRAEHAPAVAAGDALTFSRWRDSFVADLERRDFQPQRELAFTIPKPESPVTVFAVADPLEPAWRTFAAQIQAAASADAKRAPAPTHVTLFYDASGSARERDRQRELDFIAAWLARAGDVRVDLIAFRNDLDAVQRIDVRGGDTTELRRAIDALPLDGGSSYGALRVDPKAMPDAVLIVGDGLSNFGGHEPELIPVGGRAPRVLIAHAAQAVDAARLARIARRYGGQVFNLLEVDPKTALEQADAARWMLLSTTVLRGDCSDLAPAAPQPVQTSMTLYGRCRGEAELELKFGSREADAVTRRVVLNDATALDAERGRFVSRLWAVARIAEIEADQGPDALAITELATRHGVVTRNTSMLVLDRIEDYVRYRVEPYEPELAAQYRQALAMQAKQRPADTQRQAQLTQVLQQWETFKAWHDKRHPWLETVLAPATELEAARWKNAALNSKSQAHAESLAKRAQALQQRWMKEGADDASRAAWEREAIALMLEFDALRQQRLVQAPNSEAVASPDEGDGGLDRVEVTGSRLAEAMTEPVAEVAESAQPVMSTETLHADSPAGAPPPPSAPRDGGSDVRMRTLAAPAEADSASAAEPPRVEAGIALQPWDPQTPYLARIRSAADPYAAYLIEREAQAKTPAFFLDCADWFRNERKDERLALRIVSNLAEIDFESAPLLRVLAYRLQQWNRFDLAVPLFEVALTLRGEEPQSRRDLALALSRQSQPDWSRAVDLLWEIVTRSWDGRFPEIQVIALHELNDVLERAPHDVRSELRQRLLVRGADERLLQPVPVGLRVVLSWDADNTDVDLWVIDPTGDIAIYSQPETRTGGNMSADFTGGYGPEVFTIRRPLPGTYLVKAHYYGDRQQKLTGAATVQAEFLTDFAGANGKREAVTRRLEGDEAQIEIGRFTVR
jgi:Ca-activated chloride channel family protein